MRALVNGHFFCTRTRDSTTMARRHARAATTSAGRRSIVPGMTDPTIQRIESFQCRRGSLSAERRNRGYTLYRANAGTPVARLRPTGQVEVLYWSLWKERWTNAGPLGRTVLPRDDAPRLIASEDIFWAASR
jgi:hypothetical protein